MRLGNPDAAQNIGAAGEKGIGQHPDCRPDDGDAGIAPGQPQQLFEGIVDQGGARNQRDIGIRQYLWRPLGRTEEWQFVRL